MTNYAKGNSQRVSRQVTVQTKVIPGRESEMIENSAGGFVFELDQWKILDRFLILGVETSTYYISAKDLIKMQTANLDKCINTDASRVLKRIYEVSKEGRAPKQDSAIYALAKIFASKDNKAKKEAVELFPEIIRTGSHLFMFSYYLNEMRGWGRAVRKAVANWYKMDVNNLQYQIVKYQGRSVEGSDNKFTHKDVLRLSHVHPVTESHNDVFKYIFTGAIPMGANVINAVSKLHDSKDNVTTACKLIKEFRLPHETWPNELKNEREIWASGLEGMPLTALIRNLGKMTSISVFNKDNVLEVVGKLTNQEYILKSRVHPMTILNALMTYKQGHGFKGSLTWMPHKDIVYALDKAFYLAFGNVQSTGKRLLLALDISGSMGSQMSQNSVLTCRDASAAMALITANVEKDYKFVGFSHHLIDININPDMSLEQAIKVVSGLPFGGTDCSLPMVWAKDRKEVYDGFAVYTDNETYAGRVHPSQALRDYRKAKNVPARLAVVAMTPSNFSIADPKDSGMMDFVGFDTATPEILNSFMRGEI